MVVSRLNVRVDRVHIHRESQFGVCETFLVCIDGKVCFVEVSGDIVDPKVNDFKLNSGVSRIALQHKLSINGH
ncbi:hypothetical protein SDC9_143151 [bioreactor metagenome]|uniref:Uncharacterized protein n=1 Tax=bioreactor metagenome TaxID=1076179 RepID=A0A645E386_9ZZZZ